MSMKAKVVGAGLALASLLIFYLAFPDKVYIFDGVMFSYIIERRVVDLHAALWNRHHLLFIPFMMLLRDALARLGLKTAAYPLIQKVNACAGVLGVGLYYRILRRLTKDAAVSGLCSLALGLSYSYWCRATEGQVYMLMTLGFLATVETASSLLEKPGMLRTAALCVTLALAFLFNSAAVAACPVTGRSSPWSSS